MEEVATGADEGVFDAEEGTYGAEESILVWKRAPLVRRPMRMAPLFRIMDDRSSGMEKVALIWRTEALLLSLW